MINYDITAITALLQATMLWPVALTRFPMDGWGNVKVPQLPQELSVNNTKTNKWIDVDTRDHHYWVSLSGIPIQGLPDTGSSSFSLQSTYMSASCSDVMRLPTEGLAQSLERIGLLREPGLNTSVPFKPWLDDYNNNVTRSMYLSTSANYFKNAYPQQLTFYSIAASLTPGESILRIADPKSIDIFNCTLVTADIEAKIACNAKDCRAVQVRQYIAGDFASHFPLGETALERFLIRLPHSLGKAGTSSPDPADNYLLGSDSPYTLGFGAFTRDGYANVSGSVFAKRLTTLMNTAWQASLCPYGISLGSTINFTACQAVAARNIAPVANTSAEITKIIPLSVYATNKWHAIVLLLISILLQLAAFATLGLSALTKSPNILGFVSSLTRDNPYMTGVIPDGGSALDGAERARALGHVRVRLADLRPGDTIGRVVLTSDDGSNWRAMGKLSGKRRLYE